jgi:polyferredoxin
LCISRYYSGVVDSTFKKEISMEKFSTIRKSTQFTSLAISSTIFAIAFYGLMTHNDLYFEIGLLPLGFIIAGGVLLAPILGRFWCGWLCPRGTFLEYSIEKISNKFKIPIFLTHRFQHNNRKKILNFCFIFFLAGLKWEVEEYLYTLYRKSVNASSV